MVTRRISLASWIDPEDVFSGETVYFGNSENKLGTALGWIEPDCLTAEECLIGFLSVAIALKEYCSEQPRNCKGCIFITGLYRCQVKDVFYEVENPCDLDLEKIMSLAEGWTRL